ncbi:uncharacterized protein LOC125372239 [Haliotis rufescens]|uniref:uncharacterized protein LOC125372239 n=1 Tax=Haliotis rufescens TaxID=6454 RepID=UPI00201F1F1E|nr:uncharacterized protein LOC125372239 [Haliotis rufescens]
MDMGAVALVTAILAMSVCTTAFKPVNFKPLTFAQHLNKFFGVTIRKPNQNSGEPTGKYTEASGTVDGVDVVLSGPETGSKQSTTLPSADQVNIDIQETLTPPTPPHQLPAFNKTLFKSTSSDAGGNSPKLLLPGTLVPQPGSKTSTPTPSLNQVNIDIQETLTPPTPRHQLPASNKTVLTSSTSDAENIVSNVLLHETTVPTTARQTKNITMSKKSDIRKKNQLLFVTLVKQIAGLETKSRGFGIIPREAQIESDGEGIPVSFSKLAGRVLALSEALLAYVKNESYSEGAEARFSDRQYAGTLETRRITKPSGMAFSNIHKDVMYVINDGSSEAGPVILALNKTGELLNYFKLKGASNNDWAALQIAPCSSTTSRSCIYIGDIDDPDGPKGTSNIIYICQEPEDLMGGHQLHIEDRIRIKNIDESSMVMIVSPRADIYLIPQRKHESTVYKIRKGKITAVCQFKFESKWSGPVDGDISADGDMMLIKTYDFVYYFYIPERDYPEALCYHTTRAQLKYTWELYGEVVTFSPDAMSYYTCNQQLYSPLWRYDRLKIKEVDY